MELWPRASSSWRIDITAGKESQALQFPCEWLGGGVHGGDTQLHLRGQGDLERPERGPVDTVLADRRVHSPSPALQPQSGRQILDLQPLAERASAPTEMLKVCVRDERAGLDQARSLETNVVVPVHPE